MQEQNQATSPYTLEVLNKLVSYQANTWSEMSKELTIKEALLEIKSEKYKQIISTLRHLIQDGKRDKYTSHKRSLPAVTFCGTFNGERQKTKLKTYNSVVVLDIDKIDDAELNRCKSCLLNEETVFSFWESPSKEGVKGLVFVNFDFEVNAINIDVAHKSAFRKLAKYFHEKHNIELDTSGSDTTRLCFFSYDPAIVIKETIIPFEVSESDLSILVEKKESIRIINSGSRDTLFNPNNRNKPINRHTIAAIIKYLEKKGKSITYSYENWYKVAMAIANTFTYDVGEKYFLKLSSMDEEKYNESSCISFLKNCYEARNGEITFKTIIYLANEKDFKIKKQRDRGIEAEDENLSQVSSSNTVTKARSPEDLKE